MALARGGAVEQHGIRPALGHALAGLVGQAQHALPGSVTLGGGFFKVRKGVIKTAVGFGLDAQSHPIGGG